MSNRSFGNHPYGIEKFTNRDKKRRGKNSRKKQPSYQEMVRRAAQRIIGAMRKRGNGYIMATSVKDAVSALKSWVRNDDGKIGKGEQVYGVLGKAFNQLRTTEVITEFNRGFKLNPCKVTVAA